MAKFTDGPWSVYDNWGVPEVGQQKAVTGLRVARIYRRGVEGGEEAFANAVLIAEAPTMFNYLLDLATKGDAGAQEIVRKATRPINGERTD